MTAAGDRLVAGGEGDEGVELVAAGGQLDRVGDHLAADQRGLHPLRPHRDPVGDRDRVELHRRAAGGADALLDVLGEAAQVEVAGHRLDPGVGDADRRPAEGVVVEADPLHVGAGGGAVGAVEDGGRARPRQAGGLGAAVVAHGAQPRPWARRTVSGPPTRATGAGRGAPGPDRPGGRAGACSSRRSAGARRPAAPSTWRARRRRRAAGGRRAGSLSSGKPTQYSLRRRPLRSSKATIERCG